MHPENDSNADLSDDELRAEDEFPPFYPACNAQSLIAELSRQGRHQLANRFDTCLKNRHANLRGSDVRVTFPACGLLFCEWCRRQHIYRWRQSSLIKRAFGHASNADCDLVTIHATSHTMADLLAKNQQFRQAFRDIRRRWSRTRPEAGQMALGATREIVADPTGKFHGHWHCIVSHPWHSGADLLEKLRKQWPSQDFGRRVDAKPLWSFQTFDENLENVLLDYALKEDLAYGVPRFLDVRLAVEYWLSLVGNGGLRRIITVMAGAEPPA